MKSWTVVVLGLPNRAWPSKPFLSKWVGLLCPQKDTRAGFWLLINDFLLLHTTTKDWRPILPWYIFGILHSVWYRLFLCAQCALMPKDGTGFDNLNSTTFGMVLGPLVLFLFTFSLLCFSLFVEDILGNELESFLKNHINLMILKFRMFEFLIA